MPFCTSSGTEVDEYNEYCIECGEGLSVGNRQGKIAQADGVGQEYGGTQTTGSRRGDVPFEEQSSYEDSVDLDTDALGRRWGAVVIDSVLVGVLFALVAGVLGGSGVLLPILIFYTLTFAYFIVTEAKWRRTPGNAVLGVRVVSETGESISGSQSVARNLWRIVDGFAYYLVGFLVAIGSESNQRLGDKFADTLVVRDGGG